MCGLLSCNQPTTSNISEVNESKKEITLLSNNQQDPCGLNPVNYDSIYFLAYVEKFSSCLTKYGINLRRPFDLADADDIDTLPQPFSPDPGRDKLSNTQNFNLISKASTLEELALNFDNNLNLPIINQKIKDDIQRLRKNDITSLKKYIGLILLRVYKNQLICCQQRYDLGAFYKESDSIFYPIQYEFYRLSNWPRRDLLMPDYAYEWIITQKELSSDKLLQNELKQIEKLD